MKSSLQDFLPIVCPSLNATITNPDSLAKISNISKILPGMPVVSAAGFECHLAAGISTTDVSIAFAKSNRYMLDACFESLPSLVDSSYVWTRVDEILKKWTNKESVVCKKIENIWLEFDVDTRVSSIPEPSIFFSPHPLGVASSENYSDFMEYEWIVTEILEPLINDSLSSESINLLSKCFNFIPPGGRIFQAGVMLPRLSESKAIRLCIQGMDSVKTIDYLNSIGWIDSTNEFISILDELTTFTDSIAINISVENCIHPKIGIECYIDKQPVQSQSMTKWKMFFDFLIERGLCTSDKITALLEWPGYTEENSCAAIWPKNLSQSAMFVYPSFRSAAARIISHIKIVYQPMMPLQAKAYLWFGHRWMSPDGLLKE